MHDVKEGPANQSYGIAVAELAGIPAAVTRRARAMMSEIEARSAASNSQLDLFSVDEPAVPEVEESPANKAAKALTEELSTLDVDALSPREALASLYALRDKARQALEDA